MEKTTMQATARHETAPNSPRAQSWLRRQFGRPSGLPGELAGLIMAHRKSNRERGRWTLGLLEIASHHSVLEIGCGPGVTLEQAAALADQGFVLGIDHSDVMVRQARRRNAQAIRDGRVEVRLTSVESVGTAEEAFDRAYSVNSVGFWPDPRARLEELRSRMTRDGRVALTVQPRAFGADEQSVQRAGNTLIELLADSGFVHVRTECLSLKPVAAVCALADVR